MSLDLRTLTVVLFAALVTAALLLGIAWLRTRRAPALGVLGLANAVWAGGVALLAGRDSLPAFLTIDIANAFVVGGFSLAWLSARVLSGRPMRLPLVLAGPVLWLVACRFSAFHEWLDGRVALASGLVAVYSLAGAADFWRGRDSVAWRIVAAVILALNGLISLARIPPALFAGSAEAPLGSFWMPLLALESVLFSFIGAFLLLVMVKERVDAEHRIAAAIDSLTGIFNRRAFLDAAAGALSHAGRKGSPISVLILDLDCFKAINDAHGHPVGDAVLSVFCETTKASLRSPDIFGRLGGEEFAILLPDTDAEQARLVADRIVASFADAARFVEGREVGATVSVGLTTMRGGNASMSDLMRWADKALYRAKALGRNRNVVGGRIKGAAA